MPTTCVIEFENNPARVIYTGQILRGRVHLKLTKAKTLHGIYIKVVGSAKTHFKTHDSSKAATNKGKEEYLDERSYLVGAPNGKDSIFMIVSSLKTGLVFALLSTAIKIYM